MFQNDEQNDRDALIAELGSAGLQAFEWSSGGGIIHVVLPILDTGSEPAVINTDNKELQVRVADTTNAGEYQAFLYISTNSLRSECEIGIMGAYSDSDAQFSSDNWREIETLAEAVQEFRRLWDQRDQWLERYLVQNQVKR